MYFQGWTDSTKIKVIAPAEYNDGTTEIPYDCTSKRASILCAIASGRLDLGQELLFQRKRHKKSYFSSGTLTKNVVYMFQENGCFTSVLFNTWIEDALIPYVRKSRWAATPLNITAAFLCAGIQREFDPSTISQNGNKRRHFDLTDANEAYSKRMINLE